MTTEITTKAVGTAYNYLLQAMLASGTTAEKLSNFRVEEIVIDDATKNFKITLGYDVVGSLPFDKKRELKDFLVSPDAERVLSMMIRKI